MIWFSQVPGSMVLAGNHHVIALLVFQSITDGPGAVENVGDIKVTVILAWRPDTNQ